MKAKKYFDTEYDEGHIKSVINMNDTESIYLLMEEYAESEFRANIESEIAICWKEKLIALMEGLEIFDIDKFVIMAKIGDYRRLGERMQDSINTLLNYNKIR